MRHITLLIVLFSLVACDPLNSQNFYYTPPNTPGGRQCTIECGTARGYCQESCQLVQRTCVGRIQYQALQDYDQYTRDQFANHQPITLKARNFENTADCDSQKKICMNTCETRYQSCYESCGGVVTSSTSCSFLCL